MSERVPHKLSEREQKVIAFLKERYAKTGEPVTYEEMWKAMAGDGFHSRTALRNALVGLCSVNEVLRQGEGTMGSYIPATMNYPFLSHAGVVVAPWQPPLSKDEVDSLIASLSVLLGRMK